MSVGLLFDIERIFILKSVIICLLLVWINNSFSQVGGLKEPSLVFKVSALDFVTASSLENNSFTEVITQHRWARLKEIKVALEAGYITGIKKNIDLSIMASATWLKYPNKENVQPPASSLLADFEGVLHLKLFTEANVFTPYIIAGAGCSLYNSKFGLMAPFGGGFQLKIADNIALYTELVYRFPVSGFVNNHFVYSIGLSGNIRRKKTTKQSSPIKPVLLSDIDKDGVADNFDSCITVFGYAKYHGCPEPDRDGDGINDEEDICIDIVGTLKYRGCPVPDSDGDGIDDDSDQCLLIRGQLKYGGCPIPDSDADSIDDEADACPFVAGLKSENGCPLTRQHAVELLDRLAYGIFFDPGKSSIKTESFVILDSVCEILKKMPGSMLAIEGHTDNQGSPTYNKNLSCQRAEAVCNYLANGGINRGRLNPVGFGATRPVVANNTSGNRAQNRRVVFKLGILKN